MIFQTRRIARHVPAGNAWIFWTAPLGSPARASLVVAPRNPFWGGFPLSFFLFLPLSSFPSLADFDEGASGITLERNWVHSAYNAHFMQHYGVNNTIENNVTYPNPAIRLLPTISPFLLLLRLGAGSVPLSAPPADLGYVMGWGGGARPFISMIPGLCQEHRRLRHLPNHPRAEPKHHLQLRGLPVGPRVPRPRLCVQVRPQHCRDERVAGPCPRGVRQPRTSFWDHFSRIFSQAPPPPQNAPWGYALLVVRADQVLIDTCNPMLWPIRGPTSGPRAGVTARSSSTCTTTPAGRCVTVPT